MIWGEHDQRPAEGDWLYVIDRETETGDAVHGAWIPADLNAHHAAMAVGSVIGQPLARWELKVIDQVGCDGLVDPDHFVPEGHR